MKNMFSTDDVFKFGFTGSSEPSTDWQKKTLEALLQFYVGEKVAECHNGQCINADEDCYNVIVRSIPHVRVVFHPPTNQSKMFKVKLRAHDQKRKPLDYLKRNLRIVAESDYLFAMPKSVNEELRSGTWATVRYARNANMPICLIFPNGSIRYEGTWPNKPLKALTTQA